MPAANPFAPLIEVGGGGSVGPASAKVSASLGGTSDHHVSAGWALVGIAILIVLYRGGFRFSTKVG